MNASVAIRYRRFRTSYHAAPLYHRNRYHLALTRCPIDANQFIVAPGVTPPSAAESTWKPGAFEAAASTFPFTDVKELAQSAVREGIDPYHGRTDKTVFHENKRIAPDIALRCRTQYIADVEKGFSAGPFPSCPYKFARVCWWFVLRHER